LDGKSYLLALFGASFLERRGRADRCIEGYIISLAVGGTGLDITPAFTFCVRA
jgi:hypothetical protein